MKYPVYPGRGAGMAYTAVMGFPVGQIKNLLENIQVYVTLPSSEKTNNKLFIIIWINMHFYGFRQITFSSKQLKCEVQHQH